MEENKRIQILFRRSSPIIKIAASVAIVLAVIALIAMGTVRSRIQAETDTMRAEAARLQQENGQLEEKIGDLGSVKSVQEIAEEELDLVDPDTVIIESD